jgi:plastocyanin
VAASARRVRTEARRGNLRRIAGLAALLTLGGQAACLTAQPEVPRFPTTGTVEGTLRVQAAGAEAPDPPQIVVYLERLDGETQPRAPLAVETIHETAGSFSPDLLVVAPGQTVRFSNEDGVYHQIFSSSEPNAFDLGSIKADESREVTFAHHGVVRVYCSLHPWESGVIFVAPTSHFHTVQPPGRYEILDVPPGRYRLSTWGDALRSANQVVTVQPGQASSIELAIEGGGPVR